MKQIITIVVLLASLFFSCGDGKVSETETEQEAASSKTSDTIFYAEDDDTIKFKFEYTLANMPSPASAIQELKLYGVPYSKQLLNETTKIPGYPDEFKLALNMGVYAIDMTYAMSNRFGSDVVDYSRGIMMLAQRLDLNKAINLLIGKRAENNMNNRDSIFKIIDEILIKSDSYLKTNKRILTATAIYTGSWIETNYLHCEI